MFRVLLLPDWTLGSGGLSVVSGWKAIAKISHAIVFLVVPSMLVVFVTSVWLFNDSQEWTRHPPTVVALSNGEAWELYGPSPVHLDWDFWLAGRTGLKNPPPVGQGWTLIWKPLADAEAREVVLDRLWMGAITPPPSVYGAVSKRMEIRVAGFPFPALTCRMDTAELPGNVAVRTVVGGYRVSESIVIPYLPCWPGWLYNTAAMLPVAWLCKRLAVDRVRIHRRRRQQRRACRRTQQGRCAGCAYPLAGISRCPECGLDRAEQGVVSRPD